MNTLKVNGTLPDLRFPEPPESLEKRQQQRNMVRKCQPALLTQLDGRFRAGSVFTTVGTRVPAKPLEGMPAELDPGMGVGGGGGGERQGV